LSPREIYVKAAEMQQRMWMEWDEEAIDKIAAELLRRQNVGAHR